MPNGNGRRHPMEIDPKGLDHALAELDWLVGDNNIERGVISKMIAAYLEATTAPSDGKAATAEAGEGVGVLDVCVALREWFGGERYARDHEYLDAQYSGRMRKILEAVFADRYGRPAPDYTQARADALEEAAKVTETYRDDFDISHAKRIRALTTAELGEGAWCQPTDCGKPTPRQFIVRYADQDVPDAVFDDEAEAYEHFHKANTNWTCWLFGTMPLHRASPSAQPSNALTQEIASYLESRPGDAHADKLLRRAMEALAQPPVTDAGKGEAIAWESTTDCYIKFVTDSRYQKFSPKVRAWYKPYRCSHCARTEATEEKPDGE